MRTGKNQSVRWFFFRKIGRVKALPFLEERYIIKFTSEHKGELVLQAERKENP